MRAVMVLNAVLFIALGIVHAEPFPVDTVTTAGGDLKITFIGHGSLMFDYGGKNIQVDPYGELTDYGKFPKADLILITHEHKDHTDPAALKAVRSDKSIVVLTAKSAEKVPNGIQMRNGDVKEVEGIKIEAVPAYNLKHMREGNTPFHPKGEGNGYVLTFGDKRVYVAGDTENVPEMKNLSGIDIAFLPMNLPYTMTPEMVADGARMFKPKVLYPYHTGNTDVTKLQGLITAQDGIEVRVRPMK